MLSTTVKKSALTVAGLAALALGGAAVSGAADSGSSSGSSSSGTRPPDMRPDREPLSAGVAAKVKAAALDKVPGATVLRTEAGGHGRHGGAGGGETALTGDTKQQVEDAVLAKYPGATIVRTETNADSAAPYESHIQTSAGKELEVLVSRDFKVVDARAARATVGSATARDQPLPKVGRVRVLVAEDVQRVAEAVARGLRREGAAVDVALDGSSALAKARAFDYDVLVLDRDLPELHGDAVCEAVRREQPETRILMLTAYGEVEDLVHGLAIGADDYLPSRSRSTSWSRACGRWGGARRRAGPPCSSGAASGSTRRGTPSRATAGRWSSRQRSSPSWRRCWRPTATW